MTSPGRNDDAVWVDVLPALDKLVPGMKKALGKAMPEMGKQSGEEYAREWERAAKDRIEKASAALAAARKREADSTDRARVAQLRLQELIDKGRASASQLAQATANLTKAQRDQAAASDLVSRSTRILSSAQGELADGAPRMRRELVDTTDAMVEFDKAQKRIGRGMSLFGSLAKASFGALGSQAVVGGLIAVTAAAAPAVGALTLLPALGVAAAAPMAALGLGLMGVGDAFKNMGDPEKFAEAMAKLAPAAREFVMAAKDARPAFDAMRLDVQNDLFQGLAGHVDALASRYLPLLSGHLQGFAADLNLAGQRISYFLQQGRTVDDVNTILGNSRTVSQELAAAARPLVQIFTDLAVVGSDFLPGLAGGFGDAAQRMADFVRNARETGQLKQFMSDALSVVGQLGSILGNVGRTIYNVFKAGQDVGAGFLATLVKVTDQIADFTGSAAGQQSLSAFFDAVARAAAVVVPLVLQVGSILLGTLAPGLSKIAVNLAPLVQQALPLFRSLLEGALAVLIPLAGWIGRNAEWLLPMAVGIFTAVKAVQAIIAVKRTWTAVQLLLNVALRNNPIGIVITVLGALVAGLVTAYLTSDTFRAFVDNAFRKVAEAGRWMWENVLKPAFEGLKVGWALTMEGIRWAWDNVLRPTWDALVRFAGWMWTNVLAPTFRWISDAWSATARLVEWGWNNIVRPTWDALVRFAGWMWTNVLQPTFRFVSDAWTVTSRLVEWAWNNIIRPSWDALVRFLGWVWSDVLQPTFRAISDAWSTAARLIEWAWVNIVQPTYRAVASGAEWLWRNVLAPTFDAIGRGWDAMGRAFGWVKDRVIQPVFDGLMRAVDVVRSGFQTAVDWIGRIWDSMREKLRGPVQWVVDVVWNNGLRALWNTINDLWSGGDLPRFAFSGGGVIGSNGCGGRQIAMASGGVLPGYTPGRDVHHFVSPTGGKLSLSGGEAIMRPEFTAAVGPAGVDMLNRMAMREGAAGLAHALGVGGLRSGGSWAQEGRPTKQAFAGGGVFGMLPDWMTNAIPGVGALRSVMDAINGGGAGGGLFGAGMVSLAKAAAGKVWEAAKRLFDSSSAAAGGGAPGVPGSGNGGTWGSSGGGFPPPLRGVLSRNTADMVAMVRQAFPMITSIGTLGNRPNASDHPMGKAADFMIPGWQSQGGKALGYRVAGFLAANASRIGLKYQIFDDLISSGQGWRRYTHPNGATSNPTLRHLDHVHASVRDRGGLVRDGEAMLNLSGLDERVLSREHDAVMQRLVDATLAAEGPGMGEFHGLHIDGDVYTQDMRGLERMANAGKMEALAAAGLLG